MDISGNIRRLLQEQKRPASWLAEKTGITRGGLSKMLDSGVFRTDTLALIAKALEVPISALLGEEMTLKRAGSAEMLEMSVTLFRAFSEVQWLEAFTQLAEKDSSISKETALKGISERVKSLLKILIDTPLRETKTDEEKAAVLLETMLSSPVSEDFEKLLENWTTEEEKQAKKP